MDTALNIIGAIGAIIGIGFLVFFAYLICKVFQLFMTIGFMLFGIMPEEDKKKKKEKKKEEPKIEDVELLP